MRPQIQSGLLRMMAVTSSQRSPTLPDVPTLAESGLKDFEIINVVGIDRKSTGRVASFASDEGRFGVVTCHGAASHRR